MASDLLSSEQQSLPIELVLLVIEHLEDDYKTLGSLAATCSGLQHLAEERLYKTIELDTVNDLQSIISAFGARRARARAVQTLKLQYQYKPDDLDDTLATRRVFNECVANMVNLREWYIESPYDNFHWNDGTGGHDWVAGDMQCFRAALEHACIAGPAEADSIQAERRLGKSIDRMVGLAQLEHLTVHSHGPHTDFWELDGFHCLFRHPALRYLHVSCIDFPEAMPDLDSQSNKTPLNTLIFDECILNPSSLKSILRMPARLKHLTLGENVFNVRRSKSVEPLLTRSPKATIEALSTVAHSLETLIHLDPGWRVDFEPQRSRRINCGGEGLRNFHALKTMRCETSSFLYRAILMNHELAPPSLETLQICRHWDVLIDFFDYLPEIETFSALPSLATLELIQSTYIWNDTAHCEYICDDERLRNRHAFGYKLFKCGINLRVCMELHQSPGLIPPYLHGEALPETRCVYDAAHVGFNRCVSSDDVPDLVPASATSLEAGSEGPRNSDESSLNPSDAVLDKGPHYEAAKNSITESLSGAVSEQEPYETDLLDSDDIAMLRGRVYRIIEQLKHLFVRQRRARSPSNASDLDSWLYDEELSDAPDIDEDDDLGMDMDDVDIFQDQDGNVYIGVFESGSEDEEDDDEEWTDAPEEHETHPDLD